MLCCSVFLISLCLSTMKNAKHCMLNLTGSLGTTLCVWHALVFWPSLSLQVIELYFAEKLEKWVFSMHF